MELLSWSDLTMAFYLTHILAFYLTFCIWHIYLACLVAFCLTFYSCTIEVPQCPLSSTALARSEVEDRGFLRGERRRQAAALDLEILTWPGKKQRDTDESGRSRGSSGCRSTACPTGGVNPRALEHMEIWRVPWISPQHPLKGWIFHDFPEQKPSSDKGVPPGTPQISTTNHWD